MLRALSLGAGIQSSTVALMAATGELGLDVDCAIFADTGDEPAAVYRHLNWLIGQLPFPVHLTKKGTMRLAEALLAGDDEARIPAFVRGMDGKPAGLAGRQCTRNFKIRPIRHKVRELLGKPGRAFIPAGAAEILVGISKDEAWRMKPSGVRFMVNRWPLIEKGMTRRDCETWMEKRGYPRPPKSACTYCPLQENARHAARMIEAPEEHQANITLDRGLRTPENVARFRGYLYLHRSLKPLEDVDFSAANDDQGDLFANECEGICGV